MDFTAMMQRVGLSQSDPRLLAHVDPDRLAELEPGDQAALIRFVCCSVRRPLKGKARTVNTPAHRSVVSADSKPARVGRYDRHLYRQPAFRLGH